MTDATVLGIHPPNTVRIEYDDSYEDWPFDAVDVLGDRINIIVWTGLAHTHTPPRVVLHYPYEHAHEQPDGSWRFLGGVHREFFIRAGAPEPFPLDTNVPMRDLAAA